MYHCVHQTALVYQLNEKCVCHVTCGLRKLRIRKVLTEFGRKSLGGKSHKSHLREL